MVPLISERARRVLCAGLAATALLALSVRALRSEPPLASSIASIRSFWSSGPTARLLNSPAFANDRELGGMLLRADREWALDRDVIVTLPPSLDIFAAQRIFEKAAFVLAPRRVRMTRGGAGSAIKIAVVPR